MILKMNDPKKAAIIFEMVNPKTFKIFNKKVVVDVEILENEESIKYKLNGHLIGTAKNAEDLMVKLKGESINFGSLLPELHPVILDLFFLLIPKGKIERAQLFNKMRSYNDGPFRNWLNDIKSDIHNIIK